MYKFVALLALIAVAQAGRITRAAAAEPAEEPVAILRSESDSNPDGSYTFMFEGADGSFREEKGVVQNAGTDEAFLEITGMYKYKDLDGKDIEVHYTAGKAGFVPEGTNIPDSIYKAAKAASENPPEEPKKH